MQILELSETDKNQLEKFKALEWPAADKEHYQQQQPDFARHNFIYLAKDEKGNIAAYIKFSIDTGVAWLESVIVGQDYRGKGMATDLVTHAEQIAKSKGAHKIWLETGADWEARKLYEKMDYVVRAILPNHYGNKEFVLMDKVL